MSRAFESDEPVDDWKNTNISVTIGDVVAVPEVQIQVKVSWSHVREHVTKACVNVTFNVFGISVRLLIRWNRG